MLPLPPRLPVLDVKLAAKLQRPLLMKRIVMSCLFASVGLLLAVTIATFLRHVTFLSGLMTFLVLLGMVLTFLLGAFVGFDRAWEKDRVSEQSQDAIADSANTLWIGTDTRKPQRQPEILRSGSQPSRARQQAAPQSPRLLRF